MFMKDGIVIACPKCEWQPDGEIYWKCTCGHRWNTFDTRAKCPACNRQWENTYCPGCSQSTPHETWYIDPGKPEKTYTPAGQLLRKKKKRFEERLIALGIRNYRVSYLEFLDHTKETFRPPYEVGCRMLILYSIAYASVNLDERLTIVNWLKMENIWDRVSKNEAVFFYESVPDEEKVRGNSWAIDAALTLAWALNIVDTLGEIDRETTDEALDTFYSRIPKPGESTEKFLKNLSYRNLEEVYEENLVNEAATAYFRDNYLRGREDKTHINRSLCFERHHVLNWVRQFMDIDDWDETDTST